VSRLGSTSDRPRGVLVRKPRTTIYTVLLGVAVAALAIGCLALFLETWRYGPIWTFPWDVPTRLR
jgi:hypothetical protein